MNMQLRWQSIAKGLGTLVPAVGGLANSAAGSPVGARYFYSVWLRHLASIAKVQPRFSYEVVAELGPGDALGLGICALLSGARRYIGLDRLAFGPRADNLHLLDELHALFQARAPIPADDEFPGVYPKLPDYTFPRHVLADDMLKAGLAPARLARLREALTGDMRFAEDSLLTYVAPWDASDRVRPASVDLLVSQAVLEHVDDIDAAYGAMRRWLKPDGVMSHRIDYTCHGITRDWYGHWTVSPALWRIVRGKRAYLINRLPHSAHVAAMRQNGFEIVDCTLTMSTAPAPAVQMCIPHETSDLSIKGAFVVARRTAQ
ncbi:MAG: methyltransferase domain-containing protein [Burkholderiales bacterium]|nr:methyltransferase domain-containing protein [Burkholderiales bacterium]